MGHVQDRWYRQKKDPGTGTPLLDGKGKPVREKTAQYGVGHRYKVRYVAPDGQEKSKTFPDRQLSAAKSFLHDVESAKNQGTYLDPNAGKVKFQAYAEEWVMAQAFKSTTRVNVPSRLKNQAYPFLGRYDLAAITPSTVRAWIRWMMDRGTAPSYRHVCFVHVSAILTAAVDDKKIPTNPCKARSVTKPQPGQRKVVPWSDARVKALWLALDHRVKITVPLCGGCGLRQGELFGLSPEDVDQDAGVLHVVRQVQQVGGRLVFTLPKRDKIRDVPLSDRVLAELDDHGSRFPAVPVTLPWDEPDGPETTVNLITTDPDGAAWYRQTFNAYWWKPALRRAGVAEPGREDGTHALRHYYASALLDGGESIKALSEYLGHADPGFTLRTYTHLMPSSHERSRKVIDARFVKPDGLETAWGRPERDNSRSDGAAARTGSRGRG